MKERTMQIIFTAGLFLFCSTAMGTSPVLLDFDMTGRPFAEGNEPGYTSWAVGETSGSVSKTVDGITFTLSRIGGAGTGIKSTYYKAGVQAPNYARLIGDALYVVDGDAGAGIRLTISGLSAGSHTLQSYHNAIDGKQHGNISISVNGTAVKNSQPQTNRKLVVTEAASSFITFNVNAGQTVTIDYTSLKTGSCNNVFINNLTLDLPDPNAQATNESPADRDYHADADDGTITLSWKAASNAKSHDVYFGIDSAAVENATTSSPEYKGSQTATTWKATGLTNLKVYWWRIDEKDQNNFVTRGKLWRFSPRHLAFPGAEGYGRYARGGRGGKVVHVTNLNDAGAGSFRDAVENQTGPRTIVFDVGGVITLKSRLVLGDPCVTVAGQTAPGKGICIRSAPVGFTGDDLIVRHMKVRLGYGTTYDGMGLTGANYSILDHCSISWTIDEAFSSRGGKNITLQRTLISEALNIADHANYPAGTGHGYAATIGGDIGSFHHNLLAHCAGRNWSMGGGLDGNGYYAGRLDIFNNVVYNWHTRATDGGAHEVNFVGNYYKEGAATSLHQMLSADLEGAGLGSQSYYYSGNILQAKNGSFTCNGTSNECGRRYTLSNGQKLDWTLWVSSPFFPSHATIHPAKDAYKSVLSDVGMNMPVFDDHDKRIIRETLNGTTTYKGSKSGLAGIPDRESDVGGYENYPTTSRPAGFDSDGDGMPDWYEIVIGTNPNSGQGNFSESNADPDGDGYTNLEDYLNWMATPHVTAGVGETVKLNMAELTRGYTLTSPTWKAGTSTSATLSVKDSILSITPTKAGEITYFTFTVTDRENSSMTRTVGLFVEGATGTKPVSALKKVSPEWRIRAGVVNFRSPVSGTLSLCDIAGREIISLQVKENQWRSIHLGSQIRIAIFKGEGVHSSRFLNPVAGNAIK